MTQESFFDDFGFRRMRTSIRNTMREGKEIKAESLKRSKTGEKKKDEETARKAKKLLWSTLG